MPCPLTVRAHSPAFASAQSGTCLDLSPVSHLSRSPRAVENRHWREQNSAAGKGRQQVARAASCQETPPCEIHSVHNAIERERDQGKKKRRRSLSDRAIDAGRNAEGKRVWRGAGRLHGSRPDSGSSFAAHLSLACRSRPPFPFPFPVPSPCTAEEAWGKQKEAHLSELVAVRTHARTHATQTDTYVEGRGARTRVP